MFEGTSLSLANSIRVEDIGVKDVGNKNYGTKSSFNSPSTSPPSSLSYSSTSTPTPPPAESRPNSRAGTIGSRIRPNALPHPTYHPPDPTKKSHARKQPVGHVPRPRNAFILFRCDFVRQKKVPADVENDHRNISRIAGGVWREMSDEQKGPWLQMAEMEKKTHAEIYPGYRYTPGAAPPAKTNRKKPQDDGNIAGTDGADEEMKGHRTDVAHDQDIRFARRSSSCPPVQTMSPVPRHLATRPQNRSNLRAPPFPLYPMPRRRRPYLPNLEWPQGFGDPKQRIDLLRRARAGDQRRTDGDFRTGFALTPVLSCPSAAVEGIVGDQDQNHQSQVTLIQRRRSSWPPSTFSAQPTAQAAAIPVAAAASELNSPPPAISKNRRAFTRDLDLQLPPTVPVLHGGPYAIAPPGDAPGWDCAPAPPMPWEEWRGAGERIDWEGWAGMAVDDGEGVFDVPNDMNFPAAEFPGYSSAAIHEAHGSLFSEAAQMQAQVSTTPKLQPFASGGAKIQPVFTNPFASQAGSSTVPRDRVRDSRTSGVREASEDTTVDGMRIPKEGAPISSGAFASDAGAFGHQYQAGMAAYPDFGLSLLEEQPRYLGKVAAYAEYGILNKCRAGVYGDDEDGSDEDDREVELEIGSMFPRMSLDADADAEGESESESGSEDMPTVMERVGV